MKGLLLSTLAALAKGQTLDSVRLRGSQRVLSTETDEKSVLEVVGESLLPNSVRRVGDGAGLTFSTSEQEINEFHDISKGGGPIVFQNGCFGTVLRANSSEVIENKVRTKVAWAQAGCICRDEFCNKAAAVDLFGVLQADNGELRGYTPILFVDDNGDDIPCLDNLNHNIVDMDDVVYEGCEVVKDVNGSCFLGRCVQGCYDGQIENLVLRSNSTGKVIGRALKNTEKVPMYAKVDPEQTAAEAIQQFQVPEEILSFETTVTVLGIDIPITLTQDIGPLLTSALQTSGVNLVDAVFEALRSDDFTPENPGSEAELHEIIRVSDHFSDARLLSSAGFSANSAILDVVKGSPLKRDKDSQVPEASPLQEILSGVVHLAFAAGAFGYGIGAVWVQGWPNFRLVDTFTILGLLTLLAIESTAYGYRWGAEMEQNAYRAPLAIMEVVGGGRFDGVLPLRFGQDGNVFIVTTYVVEVSDASEDFVWVFVCGVILAFLFLVGSFVWVAVFEPPAAAVPNEKVGHE